MNDSIAEEKKRLRANFEKGTICACCGQGVKLYKRKLNSEQSIALISLVKLYERQQRYYHINEIRGFKWSGGGDFAKLEHWGLIEEEVNTSTQKRTSGKWKPTENGIAFAKNKITVPMYCYIYNGKSYRFSEKQTTIIEALGTNFNYAELMEEAIYE